MGVAAGVAAGLDWATGVGCLAAAGLATLAAAGGIGAETGADVAVAFAAAGGAGAACFGSLGSFGGVWTGLPVGSNLNLKSSLGFWSDLDAAVGSGFALGWAFASYFGALEAAGAAWAGFVCAGAAAFSGVTDFSSFLAGAAVDGALSPEGAGFSALTGSALAGTGAGAVDPDSLTGTGSAALAAWGLSSFLSSDFLLAAAAFDFSSASAFGIGAYPASLSLFSSALSSLSLPSFLAD